MSQVSTASPGIFINSKLDDKYQDLLEKAGEQFDIEIIQELVGGYSGAYLFLANVSLKEGPESKLVILKLDRYDQKKNEKTQHQLMLDSFSDNFREIHLVKMAYPAITLPSKRRIALFYEVAGQSLTDFRPLRVYTNKKITNLLVQQITNDLLNEWKRNSSYHPLNSGPNITRSLFETRYTVQNNDIQRFLSEDLSISFEEGTLVGDTVLPNVHKYIFQQTISHTERRIYLPSSPQHGDLNQGNILTSNPRILPDNIPYYLIDFLHFKSDGSCLFDILSLELSLIIDFVSRTQLSIHQLLPDIAKLGSLDLSAFDFATEFGLVEVLDNLRKTVTNFIQLNASSYQDDWKASFNLVGIAVGLIAVNTKGLPKTIRALAYIYAASHLKFYQERFGLAGPATSSRFELPLDQKNQYKTHTYVNYDFERFFNACNSFAPDRAYIGVFGPIDNKKSIDLQTFSRIPWSSIIDFDPDTENSIHLLGSIKEYLNLKRFVHLIMPDEKISSLNPDKACYWFAARGLAESKDISKMDLTWKYWNRKLSRPLEGFLERLANSTLKPITLIIFWDDPDDFVEDLVKMVARQFDERVHLLIVHPDVDKKSSMIKRFAMTAFPLDLSDIIDGLRVKLPATQEDKEDIILPIFEGQDKSLGYQSLPLDVFTWLEEDCEVIHFNLAITQKEEIDESTTFLRGRRINWFELNLHTDIDRDLTRELLPVVEESLLKRERTTIKLIHHPGAGGTTIACRVAWDLHWTYPVLVVRHFSNSTIDRIRDVYTRTQQPVLVIIDSSLVGVTVSQTSNLFEDLLAQRVPAVFLVVVRDFDLPPKSDRTFPLDQQLNNQEAFRFASTLSRDAPTKQKALEKLVWTQTGINRRTPFIFGLTAYEDKFIGIESFVKTRLQDISEQERLVIVIITLINYFSNQNVPAQIFVLFIGLSLSQSLDLRKFLDKRRLDLLVPEENGWRPLHALVAEEILVLLLADKKEPEQWREMLPDYAIKIIDLLSQLGLQTSGSLNQVIATLLRSLFIDRQDAESENQTLGTFETKFSNFIETIPSIEGKRLVFDKLVEEFDDEPHFWGHKSRFIWNYAKDISDYEEAVSSIDKALKLSIDEDSALYHIKGMALAKWSTHLMGNVKQDIEFLTNETLTNKLSEIEQLVQNALEVFRHIREELRINQERAYVSAIELLTRYIEFGQAISPYETFTEFLKSSNGRKYSEYLQEAENLLQQVRRLKLGFTSDSRFVREREVFLDKIYDDYSSLISGLWELLNRNDVYRPRYRRSLAYAYLAKNGRDWDRIEERDLRRILDLMEENLLADPQSNSHNIRLWFEAARRLRSTRLDYAIQKLTQWASIASRIDKLDAYYYLYALQAIAAIEGSEISSRQSQRSLEVSKQLAQDRPNRASSLDWVGNLSGIRKLVSRGSLGRFKQDTLFFGNEDISRLAHLSGRIYRIQSGQSGLIRAYGLEFFFTPSPSIGPYQFIRQRDDNLPVTFYASFSYDGPRAWNVEPS